MMAKFVFDPDFDDNLRKASNKSGSSLRPIFDKVRKITDDIAKVAKDSIEQEYRVVEASVLNARGDYSRSGRRSFLASKAIAFALRSAANSTVPIMDYDGKEIYGSVIINRTGSNSIEFGGIDPKAEIGKGTGEFVQHPPYAFLRRALDRSAA